MYVRVLKLWNKNMWHLIFNSYPTSVGDFIIPYTGNFCQGRVNRFGVVDIILILIVFTFLKHRSKYFPIWMGSICFLVRMVSKQKSHLPLLFQPILQIVARTQLLIFCRANRESFDFRNYASSYSTTVRNYIHSSISTPTWRCYAAFFRPWLPIFLSDQHRRERSRK